ncbi:MAG: hypothetical protein H6R19_2146 [Proteobacteria bacterium]|nr:hypothetical protein [Pseudomonadota bacterium]
METPEYEEGGSGRPKQADVAKRAGVSPSTVSKVINGGAGISQELRNRVQTAMKELGYDVASGRSVPLVNRRIKLVTFFQFLTRENSYFHSEVICSVLAECERAGFEIDTVLLNRDAPNDMAQYRARLEEGRADGVLFIGVDLPEILQPVRDMCLPAVIINGTDPESEFDCLSPALREGSRMATRYLIERGHREIVHVTHLYRNIIHRRMEGFKEALEEAGIPFSLEHNVIDIDHGAHFSSEKAADVVCSLIREGKLTATAIFCVSDYTAFGVIQGIQRAGKRVPEDFSVVSFDDLPLAQLCSPALTSVGVDRAALGRLAVQRLVDRWQTPADPALRIEVGARLSERNSTRSLQPVAALAVAEQ